MSGLPNHTRAHIAALAAGMSETRAKVFKAALGARLRPFNPRPTTDQVERAIEQALEAVQTATSTEEITR